jgi:hypothetical protein
MGIKSMILKDMYLIEVRTFTHGLKTFYRGAFATIFAWG